MSLFLQTLVLRGILFREQEYRQERIGVGMTLWPTRPTRGEEANEIEIGNFNTILALLAYHEFAQEHGWFAPGHGVSDSRNDNCVAPSELEPDLYLHANVDFAALGTGQVNPGVRDISQQEKKK